jgi:hypothetical protein
MTAKELQKRNNKTENLRVLQAESGQLFCESEKGEILYQVTLTEDEVSCTCGDFAKNSRKDVNFRSKHILSVMNSVPYRVFMAMHCIQQLRVLPASIF